MKKLKPYPVWVCHDCGIAAMTKTDLKKRKSFIATYHMGICEVCNEKRAVTEPRDYGHPKFKGFK